MPDAVRVKQIIIYDASAHFTHDPVHGVSQSIRLYTIIFFHRSKYTPLKSAREHKPNSCR